MGLIDLKKQRKKKFQIFDQNLYFLNSLFLMCTKATFFIQNVMKIFLWAYFI